MVLDPRNELNVDRTLTVQDVEKLEEVSCVLDCGTVHQRSTCFTLLEVTQLLLLIQI